MADFLTELLDLMPHTLTAQPGTTDAKDNFTPSGSALAIPCNIEGESKLVPDQLGRQVTSRFLVYTGQFNSLTIEGFRYSLPVEFPAPRIELKAILVDPVSDEDGTLYEIVRFP